MLTGMLFSVEKIPQLGALVFWVPLAEFIAVREKALLGSGLLFIAATATEAGVELLCFDRVEKRDGLE